MDHTAIGETIREQVVQEVSGPQSLSEMERKVRQVMLWLGNVVMTLWLKWLEQRYPASHIRCGCGAEAEYRYKREAQVQTMFGVVKYRRAYYVCPACHQGTYPLDERLGLRPNAMSAEVERLAGMVGVQMAFGKGSEVFEELTLVSLSDHSLGKAAQAYGSEVERTEAEWQAEARDAEDLRRRKREAHPPLRLYGTIDGTSVHTRGDEGDPWRELKIGAWFEATGKPPSRPDEQWTIQAENISYYADLCEAQTFADLVWATGVQRDAHLACELIFIGDAAEWIWNIVSQLFPNAIQIVDWFHACEYLAPVAHAAFKDPDQRQAWLDQAREDLWLGRLDQLIAACAQHIDPDRDKDPAQTAVTYFTNNRHRMDYPAYRANGYQIGSGTIESAAKQIGQQRLKVPGARWNVSSARWVAKARAAFLSGQWPTLAARREHCVRLA
jgi:hypothetical protein